MKCLIVDDEKMARTYLEKMCQKIEDLEVVASCENAEEALEILEEDKVDILFLDVEMPGLSGFDLLNYLSYQPNVVMTTSNTEYAFEAFEYDVSDFLKKPFNFPRFRKAIDKIKSEEKQVEDSFSTEEIYIKDKSKLVKVKFADILYIENVGDYVKVVTKGKKNYIVYGTIKSYAKKMPEKYFLKVHRSYIINLHEIKDIEGGSVVIDGKVIPVSRAHKSLLMDRLKIM
jgi:DNA-binding LytR/AlgR family response regulator